jgi:hypothetical protein
MTENIEIERKLLEKNLDNNLKMRIERGENEAKTVKTAKNVCHYPSFQPN